MVFGCFVDFFLFYFLVRKPERGPGPALVCRSPPGLHGPETEWERRGRSSASPTSAISGRSPWHGLQTQGGQALGFLQLPSSSRTCVGCSFLAGFHSKTPELARCCCVPSSPVPRCVFPVGMGQVWGPEHEHCWCEQGFPTPSSPKHAFFCAFCPRWRCGLGLWFRLLSTQGPALVTTAAPAPGAGGARSPGLGGDEEGGASGLDPRGLVGRRMWASGLAVPALWRREPRLPMLRCRPSNFPILPRCATCAPRVAKGVTAGGCVRCPSPPGCQTLRAERRVLRAGRQPPPARAWGHPRAPCPAPWARGGSQPSL